jgi:polyhydroxybutyrate depolymerase
VPLIAFHGTADPIVPFNGGPSSSFHVPFQVIPEWIKAYAARLGCETTPQELPPSGPVTGVRYSGGKQNAEVIFYTIPGGGHTWPGGDPLPEFIAGVTSQDIDATRLMWEFFQRHPLDRRQGN